MKKSIVISLIVVLMLMVATPVFAGTGNHTFQNDEAYSNTIDITATTSGGDSYSVDIEWGDMTFTYAVGGWDTSKHEYITEDTAKWLSQTENAESEAIATGTGYTLGSGQILVRNHSNQAITTEYTTTSAKPVGFDNVEVAVTAGGEIEACQVLHTEGNANVPYQTAEVTLSGVPTYRDTLVVGRLTIEISK